MPHPTESYAVRRARIVLSQRDAELAQAIREYERRAGMKPGSVSTEEIEQHGLAVNQATAARDLAAIDLEQAKDAASRARVRGK
jgi:hypothetical protein